MSAYTGRGADESAHVRQWRRVTVVLRDILTKGERSLVADDLGTLVLTMRKAF